MQTLQQEIISYVFVVGKPPINMGPTFNGYGAMDVFNFNKYTSFTHTTPHGVCYTLCNPEQPLYLQILGLSLVLPNTLFTTEQ